jgi:hypothetical protein
LAVDLWKEGAVRLGEETVSVAWIEIGSKLWEDIADCTWVQNAASLCEGPKEIYGCGMQSSKSMNSTE